jgi:putative transposase
VKWLTTEYSSEKLIIIGYNKGWKDKSNMGKKSNLIFNKIPFMKLINKIKMKFNVLLTEESYTSKCDGLALEDLSKQESYSGKRINRGLFKSSTEKIINADLNGAINIMRKQIKLTKIAGYRLMSPKRIQIYSMMFNPVDNVH